MARLIHEELSRDIIAAAMKVHGTLKPGLDEKLCENALVIELAKGGIALTNRRALRFTTRVILSEG
jgi:GxxExxY protein